MIDTIVIILEKKQFWIREPDKFSPSANFLRQNYKGTGGGECKCFYNPTKEQQAKAYYPRLTLTKRYFSNNGFIFKLKIEFSAPKLIFGNNFDELETSDFELFINTLYIRLDEMGITTAKEILLNAYVQKIDYSKNIILDKYTTCSMVISELAKLNLNKKLDLTKTDFKNEGQALAYHSSLFELKIYDKIKDLEQSKKYGEKRAIEIDNKYHPENITNPPEVLRIEGRFSRRKLRNLFNLLDIKIKNLTLSELFNKEISKKILLYYWNQITENLQIMSFDLNATGSLITTIKADNPSIKAGKILQLLGLITAMQNIGSRGARVELNIPNHKWYKLQKELRGLGAAKKHYKFVAICELGIKLEKFESVKLRYF